MIKNLKKVISTLAAVAILATSASAFAVSFPDVDAKASYAGAVEALTTLGVVNGDDNGKFNPENTVTRAEFAKMVVEALGAGNEAASSADTKFVDAKGHWAAGYIEVGVSKAFINGYDEKTFGPDDQVTYAQAVKMLVAAIGYETYASMQGGWPSGYLAYGSQLDIIAGVTGVANDTALTRAQCAVLIYNTLKAPICKVDGYEQNYKGEWVPKLEEMNGEGKNWQSLLTTKHDAWVVKGRVDLVTKDAVKGDKARFQIELAENFENEKVKAEKVAVSTEYPTGVKGAKKVTAYVGTSKAADMLFNYAEAIIQKDADTSEYTIVSITPYGAVKTVEFAVKDMNALATPVTEIKVKKDNSVKTTDYDIKSGALLYVNGVPATTVDANVAEDALDPTVNKSGTITLVDETETASTSTDNVYDYVMVTYYETGMVSSVDVDEESVVIDVTGLGGFVGGSIEVDLEEDPTRSVKFMKDGAEITYEDIKEDDILSIACKLGGNWEVDDIEVIVSDKTVAGTATGKNTTKDTVTVDGTVYDYAVGDTAIGLGNSYKLYLDAFGYIVKAEVNATSKTLGIVSAVYKSAGEYKVKLITVDGEVVTYNAKGADATAIMNAIKTSSATASTADEIFATDITAPQNAVIEYKVDSDGYVKMKSGVTAVETTVGGTGKEYSKELSMIGAYTISETATKIVALGKHFTSDGGSVAAMTMDQLEDEAAYDVYVCNNNDGVYGFAMITGDLAAIRPTSTLAVVMTTGVSTTVDDEACELVTVAINGEEDVEVYFEGTSGLAEGDVIMYKVGTEGYVETGDCIVLHSAYANVDTMYNTVLATGLVSDFTAKITSTNIVNDGSGFTIDVNGSAADGQDEDVEIFYGPVYTATENSLRIFKNKGADDVASFTEVESFSLGMANVYSYNYNKIANEGARVSATGLAQDRDFFKVENATGFDFTPSGATNVTFGTRVQPRMALVRVVDNVVTDVVYYRAK